MRASKSRELFVLVWELFAKRRQILQFLRYSRGVGIGGTVDSTEFDGLVALAREAAGFEGPLIEIGTLFGYSTQALALGKRNQQPLYTVDRFHGIRLAFRPGGTAS